MESERDCRAIAVEVYRRSLPLASYLAEAFRRRSGVDDTDQRIVAAEFDLMLLIGLGAGLMMASAALALLLKGAE